jgi:hypothetical protein
MNPTEEELLESIRQTIEGAINEDGREPNTITMPEIMERFNIGRIRARRAVYKMVAEGVLVPDPKITKRDIFGIARRVPGFRYTKGANNVARPENST